MSTESLEDKALELIKSHPNGVLQSELWKDLKIDSRKCSRVIARLEDDGKIKRTWETVKGTRTYRITYLPQAREAPRKEVNFELIMSGDHVAPCIGCTYECEPDYCPDLGNWIDLLVKTPYTETPKEPGVPVSTKPEVVEHEIKEISRGTDKKGARAEKGSKAPEVPKSKGTKVAASVKPARPEKASKSVKSHKKYAP